MFPRACKMLRKEQVPQEIEVSRCRPNQVTGSPEGRIAPQAGLGITARIIRRHPSTNFDRLPHRAYVRCSLPLVSFDGIAGIQRAIQDSTITMAPPLWPILAEIEVSLRTCDVPCLVLISRKRRLVQTVCDSIPCHYACTTPFLSHVRRTSN
jgi:hypothetical protein